MHSDQGDFLYGLTNNVVEAWFYADADGTDRISLGAGCDIRASRCFLILINMLLTILRIMRRDGGAAKAVPA